MSVKKIKFDDTWKYWISHNINRGVSKEDIFKILLEHNYDCETIIGELGYNLKCKSNNNEMKIFGLKKINKNKKKIKVPNLGDHRICMSTVILSLITGVEAEIKNFETVKTSSPSFLKTIKILGGKFEIKKKS